MKVILDENNGIQEYTNNIEKYKLKKEQDEKKQIYLEILEIFNSSFKLIDEWSFNIEVSHGFSEFYNKICNKLYPENQGNCRKGEV